jgi:hypothetical protein
MMHAKTTTLEWLLARLVVLAAVGVVFAPAPALAVCNSGNPTSPENDCDLDGCTIGQGDCNDNPTVPGAAVMRGAGCPAGANAEVCDGYDNNCSGGAADEGNPGGGGACSTGQSGVCAEGTRTCQGGALACVRNVGPTAETCNGLDDNCSGAPDEGNPGGGASCPTGQQGVCSAGTRTCQSGALACVRNVGPTTEVCDGKDNDCANGVDDGFNVGAGCTSSNVGVCRPGTNRCQGNGTVACVSTIAPGSRTETCNGDDDDCDTSIDEGTTVGCYTGPAATRNRGLCHDGTQACVGGAGSGPCTGEVTPGTEICNGRDDDCNGYPDDGFSPGTACTSANAGVCQDGTRQCQSDGGVDCISNVLPGSRTETCNGRDDDCDGTPDNGAPPVACYTGPAASRGRGICHDGTQACVGGAGSGPCAGEVTPSTETCNGFDDDCDGTPDNPFAGAACTTAGLGRCQPGTERCVSGAVVCTANQTAIAEDCNNVDDDCDGLVDVGVAARRCFSGDAGTFTGTCPGSTCSPRGECRYGTQTCDGAGTWLACIGQTLPIAEVCNSRDDDCNGSADNGLLIDADGDGSRKCGTCNAQDAGLCDCNDTDGGVRPGRVELCDAVDQNCNGRLDDVTPRKCFSGPTVTADTYTGTCPGDTCQPKGVCVAGAQACTATGAWGSCTSQTVPVLEVCDGRDDDCNGTVDNGAFDLDGDGFTTCAGDCRDDDKDIHPGAPEICDNKDNDCNGTVDGTFTACYTGPVDTRSKGTCRDGEQTCTNGVGVGVCTGQVLPELDAGSPELLCDGRDENCDGVVDNGFDQDGDGVTTCAGDCDDRNPFNKPGTQELCDCQDNNCNGVIDDANACYAAPCHDFDRDLVSNCQGDCNDTNGAVSPRRTEITGDGIDNDCDGAIDEVTDEDGDGLATGPADAGDCDDHLAAVRRNAPEVCDGFDNDCNGRVDEGFDQDGDFATTCAGDCNDFDPAISPFRLELCGNNKDDNCDGRADEITDLDGDGVTTCQGDCNDYQAAVHPAAGSVPAKAEVCDGLDNDCDGLFDEGFDVDGDYVATCFGDCDDHNNEVNPDHHEVPGNSIDDNCNGLIDEGGVDRDGDGFSPFCGDCNDSDRAINPHAAEVCDRVDNNCDGYVDSARNQAALCAVCFDADLDGQTNCDGDCSDSDPAIYRGAPEVCDLKDNDCDGQVDLEPATGLKVCVEDGGLSLGDGGADAGGLETDGGDGNPGDAGDGSVRPVVATSCGCGAGGLGAPGLLLLGLASLLRGRRRPRDLARGVGLGTLVVWLALGFGLTGCPSTLHLPPLPDAGPGGTGGSGEDAGADAGFIPNLGEWPCPGVYPSEVVPVLIPGTQHFFASWRALTVSPRDAAQLLFLDDGARDLAGFVARRDLPPSAVPGSTSVLEDVSAREIESLDTLTGTPLVQDRIERFSRVHLGDRGTRNFSAAQTLTVASATNAFALRNRLAVALSGHQADLGALPTSAGARAETQFVVGLAFRISGSDLFVSVAVTPASRFTENQTVLNDLTNGTHVSEVNATVGYLCEHRTMPTLLSDEEQAALANAATGLFDAFQRSGLDFRVGVVTTDSDVLRGAGFGKDLDQFRYDVHVGINGSGTEMGVEYGLRAIRRARLQTDPAYSLRPDAALVVVFLSDEENASLTLTGADGGTHVKTIGEYADEYLAEKAVAFAIVGPRPTGCIRVGLGDAQAGPQYIDLATRTGGSAGSICNPNLTEVIQEVLFGALGAASKSPLGRVPISGSLSVKTDQLLSRTRVNGFDYDPVGNTIIFLGAVPPAGTPFDSAYSYFDYIQ